MLGGVNPNARKRIAAVLFLLVVGTVLSVPSQATTLVRRLGQGTAAPKPEPKPVILAFGGDVHFEGALARTLAKDPKAVLAPIAPLLARADIAMVNLETAVTEGGSKAPKQFNFRAPAPAFTALRSAGVDVATMANNHGMDYGLVGLGDSLAAARAARFPVVGIGGNEAEAYRAHRFVVRGQRIAVIGATQVLDGGLLRAWTAGPGKPGLASAKDVPRLVRAVQEARRTSSTVVVYLHWGVEGRQCPTTSQRTLADTLVKAGADVVVGSHSHTLQGAGRLGGAFVAYGLGNFAFYSRGPLARTTGVLTLRVVGRRVTAYSWAPAVIHSGTPVPVLRGPAASAARRSWERLRGCTGLAP